MWALLAGAHYICLLMNAGRGETGLRDPGRGRYTKGKAQKNWIFRKEGRVSGGAKEAGQKSGSTRPKTHG